MLEGGDRKTPWKRKGAKSLAASANEDTAGEHGSQSRAPHASRKLSVNPWHTGSNQQRRRAENKAGRRLTAGPQKSPRRGGGAGKASGSGASGWQQLEGPPTGGGRELPCLLRLTQLPIMHFFIVTKKVVLGTVSVTIFDSSFVGGSFAFLRDF